MNATEPGKLAELQNTIMSRAKSGHDRKQATPAAEGSPQKTAFNFTDAQQRAMFSTAQGPIDSKDGAAKVGAGSKLGAHTAENSGPSSQALLPPAGLSPSHAARAAADGAKSNFFSNDYACAATNEKSKRRMTYGHDNRRQSTEGDGEQKLPEITASHSSQGRRRKTRDDVNATAMPMSGQYGPGQNSFTTAKPF